MQRKFGPQFFIPKKFRISSFEYKRKLNETNNKEVCSICLLELRHDNNSYHFGDPLLTIRVKKPKYFYETPCKHKFHENCLRRWVLIKTECPSCRQTIPSC